MSKFQQRNDLGIINLGFSGIGPNDLGFCGIINLGFSGAMI